MSDTNIQEGDKVQWNYGQGHPSGTVEEVQTEGKLEIESKGKTVHKNAPEDNPAVHVGREGNDVVKRASELTKLDESQEKTDFTAKPIEKAAESENKVDESKVEEAKEGSGTQEVGDKTKEGTAAEVGDKREHPEEINAAEDSTVKEAGTEQESGKEVKKQKTESGGRTKKTAVKGATKASPAKRGGKGARGGKKGGSQTATKAKGDAQLQKNLGPGTAEEPEANDTEMNEEVVSESVAVPGSVN